MIQSPTEGEKLDTLIKKVERWQKEKEMKERERLNISRHSDNIA